MTAADRALELLADTVELPGMLLTPTPDMSAREAYATGNAAALMMLLTRYRRALADLVTEVFEAGPG